ncbi:unnamed protein product, partial [Ectocarpus sp. 12 AP-2014]
MYPDLRMCAWRETRSKIVPYIMSARSGISFICCPRLQDLESQRTLNPHEPMWIPALVRLSGNYTLTGIFSSSANTKTTPQRQYYVLLTSFFEAVINEMRGACDTSSTRRRRFPPLRHHP